MRFSPCRTDPDWATRRRVLRETQMRSVLVVVAHVFCHESLQMPLIQDDHVVKQIASATSHPALSNTVLPRTAKGSAGWLASDAPHSRNHIRSEL
jgi:hypothetical protein